MTLEPEVAGDRRSAHFLSLLTWAREDFERVWNRARAHGATSRSPLAGGRVALRWERVSVRTREDFVKAVEQAGAQADEGLDADDRQPPNEVTRGWASARGAVARPGSQARLVQLARSSPVPLVNAGTPASHPFRVLADVFGLSTLGLEPSGLTVGWLGSPAPELSSWLEATVRFGIRLIVVSPGGAEVDASLRAYAEARAGDRLRLDARPEDLGQAQAVIAGGDPLFVEERHGALGPSAHLLRPGVPRPWKPGLEPALAQALLEDCWERAVAAGRVRE